MHLNVAANSTSFFNKSDFLQFFFQTHALKLGVQLGLYMSLYGYLNHANAFILLFQSFEPGLKPDEKVDQPNQSKEVFPKRTQKTQPTQPTRNGQSQ